MTVIDLGSRSAQATIHNQDKKHLVDYIAQVIINNGGDPSDFDEIIQEKQPRTKAEVIKTVIHDVPFVRIARLYKVKEIFEHTEFVECPACGYDKAEQHTPVQINGEIYCPKCDQVF